MTQNCAIGELRYWRTALLTSSLTVAANGQGPIEHEVSDPTVAKVVKILKSPMAETLADFRYDNH